MGAGNMGSRQNQFKWIPTHNLPTEGGQKLPTEDGFIARLKG